MESRSFGRDGSQSVKFLGHGWPEVVDVPGPERYRTAGHEDRGASPPGQRPGPIPRPQPMAAGEPPGEGKARIGGNIPMRRRSAVPVACDGYRSGPGTSLHPSPNRVEAENFDLPTP